MRPEPVVLLGDSMGGTVAGRFVAEALADAPAAWSRPVDGIVLVSPVLSVEMTPLQKLLLAVLEPLAPSLPVSAGIELDNLSHDPAIAHAYSADPLVHDQITARLARFLMGSRGTDRDRDAGGSSPPKPATRPQRRGHPRAARCDYRDPTAAALEGASPARRRAPRQPRRATRRTPVRAPDRHRRFIASSSTDSLPQSRSRRYDG